MDSTKGAFMNETIIPATCKNCNREDRYGWLLCLACWDRLDVWTQIQVAMAYETRANKPEKFAAWREHALRKINAELF